MKPTGTSRRRDERGLVGTILILVIVFALIAVVELSRTLQAAQHIDTTVIDIRGSVLDAGQHLNTGCGASQICDGALPVLTKTEGIVIQIDAAAKPLSGEAQQIITAATSINATVSQILASATSINGTVHSISSLAGSINASVKSIDASLGAVNADVVIIRGGPGSPFGTGAVGINNRAEFAAGLVNAIKADTARINSQAGGILTQAHSISCDKVAGLVGPLSTTC